MQYQLLPSLTQEEYDALRADIIERGVQVPVEYDEEGHVLDGHHRVQICQELGLVDWPRIVRIGMTKEQKVEHVLSLNLNRRHLSKEQRRELVGRLREQGWSTPRIAERLNISEATAWRDSQGSSFEEPVTVMGRDGKQYPARQAPQVSIFNPSDGDMVKAREIYDSGDEDLIQEMDRTGKVDGVYRKFQRQHCEIPEPPPIPSGKYSVIYADPPWCYGDKLIDGYGAAEHHYPAMTIPELCALPIHDMATDNAVLFMWVTSPLLAECFQVIDAWGFTYKASFVWDKVKHNYGHYNSVRHEFLLICTRGSCLPESDTLHDSVIEVERSNIHSEKPEYFRQLIEAMYPSGKKIELFARGKAKNWDVWGNEV